MFFVPPEVHGTLRPLRPLTLKERRKKAKLTQFDLAAAANCSVSMLQLLEDGYSPTQSLVVGRVENALKQAEAEQKEIEDAAK